jgi:hypothetical protein
MYRSSIAGPRAKLISSSDMRQNLRRPRPTSSWPREARHYPQFCRPRARSRPCFVHAPDPVGNGHVASLARPGGNATGFLTSEYNLAGKWVELLKEIAPNVTRAGVLRDAAVAFGIGQFAAIQSVAPALGVEVMAINLRDAAEIERDIASLARSASAGLILTASPAGPVHRDLIISLAGLHKLPAIYVERLFVAAGGLLSYGPDFADQYRRAASYVDRILKGEKPADLPVQAPTKYELVINLKSARLRSAGERARPRRRSHRVGTRQRPGRCILLRVLRSGIGTKRRKHLRRFVCCGES